MILNLVERFTNRVLALDPDTRARLARLQDKTVLLRCTAPVVDVYLLPGSGGLRMAAQCERTPDVILRGTALSFLKLAQPNPRDPVTAARAIEIEGDLALGQDLQAVFHRLDIDWEEYLSHFLGDVAAHELARAARGGSAWVREASATLARNVGEYLQYEHFAAGESRGVPSRSEVAGFLRDVDALRADADRLQQRIGLLQNDN